MTDPTTDPRLNLSLPRLEQDDFASYGHLLDGENKQLAVTLELPWRNNAHGVSCVPAGTYTARRRYSAGHKCEVFGLVDVPNRDDIELHWGCLPRDTKGCILLGTMFGFIDYNDGRPGASGHGIGDSRHAFDQFMALMHGIAEFTLTITDPPASPTDPSFPEPSHA